MSELNLPWHGGCRCGAVRFAVTMPPLLTMACHCTGCQRMTASAFSLSTAIPTPGFEVTEGEPVLGGLKGAAHHFFCPACLSWLYTRAEGMDGFVNVRATLLDDPSWFVPFVETWTREKLPWAGTPAWHSFEGFPAMEEFPALLQAFAEGAWRA